MSDKSDLKAELERKKQRLAQIREEKKRKEEERKKKEVSTVHGVSWGKGKSLDSEGLVKEDPPKECFCNAWIKWVVSAYSE